MKSLLLITLTVALTSCLSERRQDEIGKLPHQTLPFTFQGIDTWDIRHKSSDEEDHKYHVVKGDVNFTVKANLRNNDLIMCFCAPLESYRVVEHDGYKTYEWPDSDSHTGHERIITMKYQGEISSLDVHYRYREKEDTWPMVESALRSLRPVEMPAQPQAENP